MRRENLSDRRFGALIVLEQAPSVNKETRWLCRCDCGTEKIIWTKPLKRGLTKTCGCLIGTGAAHHQKHGASNTPEWGTWRRMRDRCTNPNNQDWHLYGGKGISVAPEWLIFKNFLADMGPRPSDKHSIDRINGNLNYTPDNCRWATARQQANNIRVNRILTFNGQSQTLAEWSRITGLSRNVIEKRIDKLKWSVEDALTYSVWNR